MREQRVQNVMKDDKSTARKLVAWDSGKLYNLVVSMQKYFITKCCN